MMHAVYVMVITHPVQIVLVCRMALQLKMHAVYVMVMAHPAFIALFNLWNRPFIVLVLYP